MAPGVDLNIDDSVWEDYKILILKLQKKFKDKTISASKRVQKFMEKELEEFSHL